MDSHSLGTGCSPDRVAWYERYRSIEYKSRREAERLRLNQFDASLLERKQGRRVVISQQDADAVEISVVGRVVAALACY